MPGIPAAPALRWLFEAFALAPFYLLLAARLNLGEVVLATAAASLVATLKLSVVSSAERRFAAPFWQRVSPGRAGAGLLSDSLIVAPALIAALLGGDRVTGRFVRVRFAARGEAPETATRRAEAVFVVSLAPNSYLVDVDERRAQVIVHQLVPDRAAIDGHLARLGA